MSADDQQMQVEGAGNMAERHQREDEAERIAARIRAESAERADQERVTRELGAYDDLWELLPEWRYEHRRSGLRLPSEWQTKNGRVLDIAQAGRDPMTDDHLVNTMLMLVRSASVARARDSAGYMEMSVGPFAPRGDGAQDAFDAEARRACEATWADHASLSLLAMISEARRRGLPEAEPDQLAAYGQDQDKRTLGLELEALKRTMERETRRQKLRNLADSL